MNTRVKHWLYICQLKQSDINDNNNPKPSNNEKNDYLLFEDNIVNTPKNEFNNDDMLPTQLNFLEIENKKNSTNSELLFVILIKMMYLIN